MDVNISTFVIAIIIDMNISVFSGRLSEWPTIIHGICGLGNVLQKVIFLNVQNTDERTLYVILSNKTGCPKVSL